MKVFHPGMPEWKKAGALVLSEPAALEAMINDDASFVLVDLRELAESEKGFIKDAVNITASKLAAAKEMFPADKKANIILYSASGIDIESFKAVRSWGYPNVTAMAGGLAAWKGALVTGKPAEVVNYVKKTPKGQVSIEEFKEIAKNKPSDKVILDVREAETQAAGKIGGALTIPTADLDARMKEIPMDKEVIIHCNTGILASSAMKTLKEKGYTKVRFLNAVIQVAADGSFEIAEK